MSQKPLPHGFLDDVISRRLLDLAASVERSLGQAVRVERRDKFCGEISLRPSRPDAMPVSWIDFGPELGLYAGTRGWWEFERDVANVAFIEDVVWSIVAGRVEEVLAPGRSRLVGDAARWVTDGRYGPRRADRVSAVAVVAAVGAAGSVTRHMTNHLSWLHLLQTPAPR